MKVLVTRRRFQTGEVPNLGLLRDRENFADDSWFVCSSNLNPCKLWCSVYSAFKTWGQLEVSAITWSSLQWRLKRVSVEMWGGCESVTVMSGEGDIMQLRLGWLVTALWGQFQSHSEPWLVVGAAVTLGSLYTLYSAGSLIIFSTIYSVSVCASTLQGTNDPLVG